MSDMPFWKILVMFGVMFVTVPFRAMSDWWRRKSDTVKFWLLICVAPSILGILLHLPFVLVGVEPMSSAIIASIGYSIGTPIGFGIGMLVCYLLDI